MMLGLTRADAVAQAARKRSKPRSKLPPTPQQLHTNSVTPALVALAWRGVKPHPHRLRYDVFRNGRHLASTPHPLFTDHSVKPLRTYRYSVRARVGSRHGHRSRTLTVRTPSLAPYKRPVQPPGPPPDQMTQAMVDRLFWRAGFGPSEGDRQYWTGQRTSALVEHFLTTPYSLAPTSSSPTYHGNPIDPLATDQELQMDWLDRMQRTTNPFIERMNFFWHRHWAVSRDAGVPSALLLAYRDRLRRYSDFAANPAASFRGLALEMTTQDAAMSMYLTGFLNQKNAPNENYAREFMELFTLGVTDASGNPNYNQSDVHQLARAFTGYTLNQASATVTFNPSLFDPGVKTILSHTGTFDAPAAVDLVLSRPSHAPFLIRKLWGEFIQAPIPPDALAALTYTYVATGFQLAPLLRAILRHPLMFASLGEPTMTKPPVVYTVGVLRALAALA